MESLELSRHLERPSMQCTYITDLYMCITTTIFRHLERSGNESSRDKEKTKKTSQLDCDPISPEKSPAMLVTIDVWRSRSFPCSDGLVSSSHGRKPLLRNRSCTFCYNLCFSLFLCESEKTSLEALPSLSSPHQFNLSSSSSAYVPASTSRSRFPVAWPDDRTPSWRYAFLFLIHRERGRCLEKDVVVLFSRAACLLAELSVFQLFLLPSLSTRDSMAS